MGRQKRSGADAIIFARRLRDMLWEKRMSQTELAQRLSVSRRTVSAYANGHCFPSVEHLKEMNKIFNVSVDYLLGISDDPSPVVQDQFAEDVFVLRRSYARMSEEDQKAVLRMVQSIVREVDKRPEPSKAAEDTE